jgi:hypothetical protein
MISCLLRGEAGGMAVAFRLPARTDIVFNPQEA